MAFADTEISDLDPPIRTGLGYKYVLGGISVSMGTGRMEAQLTEGFMSR